MTDGPGCLDVREEAYDGPVAQQLVSALQQEYVDRYGGVDATPVEDADFAPPRGRFVVVFVDDRPAACGGLRLLEPDAEIKRMYVAPEFRGHGLACAVLARLESAARELGARRTILETGPRQPEAMALYESSGYERIPGYGYYRCAPGSRCYGKSL